MFKCESTKVFLQDSNLGPVTSHGGFDTIILHHLSRASDIRCPELPWSKIKAFTNSMYPVTLKSRPNDILRRFRQHHSASFVTCKRNLKSKRSIVVTFWAPGGNEKHVLFAVSLVVCCQVAATVHVRVRLHVRATPYRDTRAYTNV